MGFAYLSTCESCGAKNRVPASHLSDSGRCGSCKATLPPVHEPINAGTSSFDEIVAGAKVPVLVDFWADWCGPCKMVAPEVKALAQEMAGQAVVLKVDTEAEPVLAQRYRVQSIPNFMIFVKGRPVMQQPGAVPRSQMRRWLEQAASAAR